MEKQGGLHQSKILFFFYYFIFNNSRESLIFQHSKIPLN